MSDTGSSSTGPSDTGSSSTGNFEALEQRLTRWQGSIQTLLNTMDQARTQMPAALVTEQAHEASEA